MYTAYAVCEQLASFWRFLLDKMYLIFCHNYFFSLRAIWNRTFGFSEPNCKTWDKTWGLLFRYFHSVMLHLKDRIVPHTYELVNMLRKQFKTCTQLHTHTHIHICTYSNIWCLLLKLDHREWDLETSVKNSLWQGSEIF